MTIFTKQGKRQDLPSLAAYQDGVYVFPFYGDETYTDPFDGSIWSWTDTTNDVDEILGVVQGDSNLLSVSSLADCIAQQGSFYWDDTNGWLYVHWLETIGDWSVGRDISSYSKLVSGYANGYHKASKNVIDGVYYKPIITNVSGLSTQVDPTKLGLLTFSTSSITLTDQSNLFKDTSLKDSVGLPVWVYDIDDDTIELTNEDRVFTGILNGYDHDRDNYKLNLIESRQFENKPVCKNSVTLENFPDAGDLENTLIPTVWGEIRRGVVVPVNSDTLTTSSSGSAVFLVADTELYNVISITNVYDKEDNIMSITGTDLSAGTVTVTKPADVSVSDLKSWKWEGQGYDIPGIFDNGLDIIKAAFNFLAGIAYVPSTFEIDIWNQQTNLNQQSIGLSIQSDKGFFEELIEPIATSLQGSAQVLGDGLVTWISRNITADPVLIVKNSKQLDDAKISVDPSKTVSEIVINYSPDFTNDKEFLTYLYNANKSLVIRDTGIDRREPLSPVKTVLVNEVDVIDLGVELSSTSSSPERKITVSKTLLTKGLRGFQIVGIDTSELQEVSNIEYGELLKIDPDYNSDNQSIEIRKLPDYVPPVYVQGESYSGGVYNTEAFGTTDGFGTTYYIREGQ